MTKNLKGTCSLLVDEEEMDHLHVLVVRVLHPKVSYLVKSLTIKVVMKERTYLTMTFLITSFKGMENSQRCCTKIFQPGVYNLDACSQKNTKTNTQEVCINLKYIKPQNLIWVA